MSGPYFDWRSRPGHFERAGEPPKSTRKHNWAAYDLEMKTMKKRMAAKVARERTP